MAEALPACPERAAPGSPSPDLYCISLTPADAAPEAAGVVHLRRPATPFGTAVSVEGVHRWNLEVSVAGLPDPASLGSYSTYVAWATTPALRPMIRLGRIGNGRTSLGPVALNQFLILVSAEASAVAAARTGPLVLRGASASTRLQPHDFGRVLASMTGHAGDGATSTARAQPDGPGRSEALATELPDGSSGHAHGGPPPTSARETWPPPPMHPAVSMPSALMRLRPDVAPFLPAAPEDGSVPAAKPAELIELADGDTLELVAGPVLRTLKGRTHLMYGFNGTYPGPLVRVSRGATIVVLFENRTEWPTAVHWHGVRLDNRFDGVPGVTQEPVPPGGRFTYRVRFPDAGIYWYHPHHREDVQQDLGLYGNLWVREPSAEPPPAHREEVLLLDDLLVGESGLVPWGREAATHALMGRFGNLLLVNGEPRYSREVLRGTVVRFYLTNASNARTWNVSFSGAPMKLVGTDLSHFEREEMVESVVLAPAERYVVDVLFAAHGSHALVNRVQAIDPFGGRFFAETDTLGIVHVVESRAERDHRPAFETLHTSDATVREIDGYRGAFDGPVDRDLVLTLEAERLPFPIEPLLALESVYANPVEWSGTMPEMNGATTARGLRWILRDSASGAENEEIDWSFRQGDLVKVRLTNDRDALHAMQHPIHVHGQRFLVLTQGGVASRNLAWKDTLLLPAGQTAEILIEVSNPGRWMLHCHTAEHLEAGMRTVFTVEPAGGSSPP
ncbi:MAG: multicopper oxidase family protein [Gemmatimonadota bacterium]